MLENNNKMIGEITELVTKVKSGKFRTNEYVFKLL